MTGFKIWWLSNEDADSAKLKSGAPKYLKDQLCSRRGRNGRGRLWIDPRFGDLYLPRTAKNRIGDQWSPGGIVLLAEDERFCVGGVVLDEVLLREEED